MSDATTWRDEISEKLGAVLTAQQATNEKVDGLRKELLGNGQPGMVPQLFARVGALENLTSRWKGGVAAVFMIAAVFGALIEWLLRVFRK